MKNKTKRQFLLGTLQTVVGSWNEVWISAMEGSTHSVNPPYVLSLMREMVCSGFTEMVG
jgi:hypothetical protein